MSIRTTASISQLWSGANRVREWVNGIILVTAAGVAAALLAGGAVGLRRALEKASNLAVRCRICSAGQPRFLACALACVLAMTWQKAAPLARLDDQLAQDRRTDNVVPAPRLRFGPMIVNRELPGAAARDFEWSPQWRVPRLPCLRRPWQPGRRQWHPHPRQRRSGTRSQPRWRRSNPRRTNNLPQLLTKDSAEHLLLSTRRWSDRRLPRRCKERCAEAAGKRRSVAMAEDPTRWELARLLRQPPVLPRPLIVREYAHIRGIRVDNVRRDFAETLYWNPVLVMSNGVGHVGFDLDDSVTTYQVRVEGNTPDGRLGTGTANLESRKPIALEPTLPIEVTSGDRIDLPLVVANNTTQAHSVRVDLDTNNVAVLRRPDSAEVQLEPNGRSRQMYQLKPSIVDGQARVKAFAGHGDYGDSVEREFRIVPDGFPIAGRQSDTLSRNADVDVGLPEHWLPGTLRFRVEAYPSTLADLQQGLEVPPPGALRLLRANIHEQLSQPAHSELPARVEPGPARTRSQGQTAARSRLQPAGGLRVRGRRER